MRCTSIWWSMMLPLCLLSSCVSQKSLTYFKDVPSGMVDSLCEGYEKAQDPILRVGDEMLIQVSALDQEAVAPYNKVAVLQSQGSRLSTTPQMLSYIVDPKGDIIFPVIGRLHVEGLTRDGLQTELVSLLSQQVVNPMVTVTLLSRKVSVLGEVNHPGQVHIPNGRLTILEALASAGDLTPYGKRNNVLITREVNGELQFARLNLNSEEIFSSPFYYLQQNDVVYVSPNKVRVVSSQNVALWLSAVSTLASAATVIVTVVNSTKR